MVFHYSFFVIFLRHFRFFAEPVPGFVHLLESLDGFLQMGVLPINGLGIPSVYLSDLLLLAGVTYLFVRRLYISQIRYISLPADYFPLFLILALGLTGVLMRYFIRVDVKAVKELAIGLFRFSPNIPDGIGTIFFIHLFILSVLIRNMKYRWLAIITMVVTVFYLFLVDLSNISLGYRIVALMFISAISLGISMFYSNRQRDKKEEPGQ